MNFPYVHQEYPKAKECARLSVAVLAGGASRRFGTDKAMIRLCPNGRTLLELVADLGRDIAEDVFVVGHSRYASVVPDLRIVPDERPGEGPLAGIKTALESTPASHVLVLACDMPCLSRALLQWMVDSISGRDVSMPRTQDGRWHPMPAIYGRTALPGIRACIDSGQHAIISLLERVAVQEFPEAELLRFDPQLESLFSLNCPEQLEHASRCATCN